MKRLIALVLCMAMVLTLAACGADETPTESTAAATSPATEAPTQPPTEAPTEAPTEPPAPTFDAFWAGSSYELPIPPIPAADFSVYFSHYGPALHYEILSDGDEIQALTIEDITAYWDQVQQCGFTVDVTERTEESKSGSTTYLFEAANAQGATIYLAYPGYMIYLILDIPTETEETIPEPTETEAEPLPEETSPAFDTAWATNDYELLIPQPPFAYEVWESACGESTYALRSTEAISDLQIIADYCESLKAAGFADIVEDRATETGYSFYAANGTNNAVSLEYDGRNAVLFLTGSIAQTAFSAHWAPAGIPQPPRFAELTWQVSTAASGRYRFYLLSCTGLTLAEVQSFADQLALCGFTEAPGISLPADSSSAYTFGACNESGIYAGILVTGDGETTLTLGIPQ